MSYMHCCLEIEKKVTVLIVEPCFRPADFDKFDKIHLLITPFPDYHVQVCECMKVIV